MDEEDKLSKDARDILELMRTETKQSAYLPKSTVQHQWSPESQQAVQELIEAGMIEEISVYRLVR